MPAKTKTNRTKRLAIVDIGSNSVRLVVYKQAGKKYKNILDKKATCRLAQGMNHDRPKLSSQGMRLTLKSLSGFKKTLEKKKIAHVVAIGTAAMRAVMHTKQGKAFHRRAEQALGSRIRIISGKEEARLTAQGLMSFLPDADGICGDMGGGSLELATIRNGHIAYATTRMLGTLTLLAETKGNTSTAHAVVRRRLRQVAWLKKGRGRVFYAIGGSWRGVGRVMMQKLAKKKRPIHGFRMKASAAQAAAQAIAGQKPAAFRLMPPKIRRRADILPIAAATLAELIDMIQPRWVVFSGHGVREGLLRKP